MQGRFGARSIGFLVLTMMVSRGFSEEAAPAAGTRPLVVLDTASTWRIYHTLKPPVIQLESGAKPILVTQDWLNRETPEPPAGWMANEFDDTTWLRGTARAAAQSCYLSRLCLRARFEVTGPAQVKDLRLALDYYGGAIVYINAKEVARGNLAKDASGPAALAEAYGDEAFVAEDGSILPSSWLISKYPKALAARKRTLADVAIPAPTLHQGTNVLAIELVRAPYNRIVDDKRAAGEKPAVKERGCPYDLSWNTCEFRDLRLTAATPDGLVSNATRPREFQVWNGDVMTADTVSDFGDRCEPLRPIAIKAVRNGVFSGKVVVGSAKPITDLKAVCSDLKQGEAGIPASQVRIRYGFAWGSASLWGGFRNNSRAMEGLLEQPLAEFPIPKGGDGVVVPIWVTVRVPPDTKPGTYSGHVTIEATGEKAVTVPVRLEVVSWTLPDTQDWRTWVEMIQSPDVLAAEYGVPLWSEKHFGMIGNAMKYMGEAGSRVVYVPLIAQTNMGNEQSMVRWIRKADNTMEYDFTVMDKYLDLAEKNMGKPRIVCFIVWESYLNTPKSEVKVDPNEDSYFRLEKSWAAARWELRGKGPAVTALDPATGKTETVYLPRYEDPAAKAVWQPLFGELRKRMGKRGLEKVMMVGMASDVWPNKAEATALQEITSGLSWVNHTHGGSNVGHKIGEVAPIEYTAFVWNCEYPKDPQVGRTYGWKRPQLYAQYVRFTLINGWPASALLTFGEINIAGQQRGVGRIGADFWPTIKDRNGVRTGFVWERYPQSLWHSLNLYSHLLVPGPEGPVASTRYEVFREGIQECEARIAIETALTDETLKAKLGEDLAKRCQDALDQRIRDLYRAGSTLQLTGGEGVYASVLRIGTPQGGPAGHAWYVSTNWKQRQELLYGLAAEVAGRLGVR